MRPSGQQINFLKSNITFTPNVRRERKDTKRVLGLDGSLPHNTYRGPPTIIGRNNRS